MNHRKFGKKLGRNIRERGALFRSQTRDIFIHGGIQTTRAKAQAVNSIVEKLANWIIVKDTIVAQRELSRYIQDKKLVSQIYTQFKAAFEGQTSNFTKMHNVKIRQGDDALIVKYEFVKPFVLVTEAPKAEEKEVKKAPVKKTVAKKVTKKVVAKEEK